MTATTAPIRDRDRQEHLADAIAYDLNATSYSATPHPDGTLVVRYADGPMYLGMLVLRADATIVDATYAVRDAAQEYQI